MQFGQAIGTACATFAITNIDDAFVLFTFFAEASTSRTLTASKITLGQYMGFTVIIIISMIGFAVSLVLPSEPIGFLGLLPMLLGVWNSLNLVFPTTEEDQPIRSKKEGLRGILTVAAITLINGGDNIGTYIPLFSQVKGPEIAVYVVVYYILLGLWCLVAFLVVKQRHVLALTQKYVGVVVPFLFMGLGVYIVVTSDCYPWSIERIDSTHPVHPGKGILAGATVFFLLATIGVMTWFKWSMKRAQQTTDVEINPNEDPTASAESTNGDSATQQILIQEEMPGQTQTHLVAGLPMNH